MKTHTLAAMILIPLPHYGFDPSEAAIPFTYLKKAGHQIVFATPDGKPAAADERMVTGKDLGLLKPMLMADKNGITAYKELVASEEFQNPISYDSVKSEEFDGLFIPGGHDKGVRELLESSLLQKQTAEFFAADKPVGIICHGALLAGRSLDAKTGKSVLYGRKITALTRKQELTAYRITKSYLGDYYLTYPETTVQDELSEILESKADLDDGPELWIPLLRDSPKNFKPGFVVRDGNLVSGRWPGDAHRLSEEFLKVLSTQ